MSKKDRLTLTQLAGYDDILTDALVDHVKFCSKSSAEERLTDHIL